jgi:hypothetical protein
MNTNKDRETITVRVSHKDNFVVVSETSFDLIVNYQTYQTSNLILCDNDTDGLFV